MAKRWGGSKRQMKQTKLRTLIINKIWNLVTQIVHESPKCGENNGQAIDPATTVSRPGNSNPNYS